MYFVVIAGFALGVFSTSVKFGVTGLASSVLGTLGMTLLPPAAAAAVMLYCSARTRRAASDEVERAHALFILATRYLNVTRALEGIVLAAYAVSLYVFSWSAMPERAHVERWALPSGALVTAPFIVSLVLLWIPMHYTESCLRSSHPTLRQRLSFNVRQYLLTLAVPVATILGFFDGVSFLPASVTKPFSNPVAQAALGGVVVLGGYTVAPLVVVRLWKTTHLPDSPMRERLTALCARIGVAFRDIRVWETPGHYFVNAAVMGVAGFVRYIVVSRTLLEVMPISQVEGVFAHELGHAKRHHMPYYLLFAGDFILLVYIMDGATGADLASGIVYAAISAVLFALWWGLGFGYVSRAFERDADLFSAEVEGDHRVFSEALVTIAKFNGVSPSARSWRHGSIRSRVEFLDAAAAMPEVRSRFIRRIQFLKALVAAIFVLSVAAILVLEHMGY